MLSLAYSVERLIARKLPPRTPLHQRVASLLTGPTDVDVSVLSVDHARSIGLQIRAVDGRGGTNDGSSV